jgi:hypothetical protein
VNDFNFFGNWPGHFDRAFPKITATGCDWVRRSLIFDAGIKPKRHSAASRNGIQTCPQNTPKNAETEQEFFICVFLRVLRAKSFVSRSLPFAGVNGRVLKSNDSFRLIPLRIIQEGRKMGWAET